MVIHGSPGDGINGATLVLTAILMINGNIGVMGLYSLLGSYIGLNQALLANVMAKNTKNQGSAIADKRM